MQIHRLCKLCSFYEKLPEDFLDETDVDSYFYHYIFDNSQSHHRIACDGKGSNKKSFAMKLFQFWDLKTKQRYILQGDLNISRRELGCFSELLVKRASVYIFHYRTPKLRSDLQSRRTISLLITIKISLNFQINKFVNRSILEATTLAPFPSKILSYSVMNLYLQNLSTLTIAKSTISAKTDITLQTILI